MYFYWPYLARGPVVVQACTTFLIQGMLPNSKKRQGKKQNEFDSLDYNTNHN